LTEGAALMVEVLKAARDDKAAGVRVLPADDARRTAYAAAVRGATPPLRLDVAEPVAVAAAKPLLAVAPDRILVDDRGALAELRRAFPQSERQLEFYGDATPLFDALDIADDVMAVLQPHLALPGG